MRKLVVYLCVFSLSVVSALASDKTDLELARNAVQNGEISTALKILKPLSDKSNPEAQALMGAMFVMGKGVAKDEKKGIDLLNKAADAGFPVAEMTLALYYRDGSAVVKKDPNKSLKLFISAAEHGQRKAQSILAAMYDSGTGVTQNSAQALHWYRLASEQGDKDAQFSLANKYFNADGVQRDTKQAIVLYKQAAEQGHTEAQNKLGVIYATGEVVPRDLNESVKWWKVAAASGDKAAIDNLQKLENMYLKFKQSETNQKKVSSIGFIESVSLAMSAFLSPTVCIGAILCYLIGFLSVAWLTAPRNDDGKEVLTEYRKEPPYCLILWQRSCLTFYLATIAGVVAGVSNDALFKYAWDHLFVLLLAAWIGGIFSFMATSWFSLVPLFNIVATMPFALDLITFVPVAVAIYRGSTFWNIWGDSADFIGKSFWNLVCLVILAGVAQIGLIFGTKTFIDRVLKPLEGNENAEAEIERIALKNLKILAVVRFAICLVLSIIVMTLVSHNMETEALLKTFAVDTEIKQ